jgi:hypothetical protein
MTKKSKMFCWWCGKPLSVMNRPDGTPWATLIEIEAGRTVRVHKTCADDTRKSLRRLTANPDRPERRA